jgi:hypothetical protein
MTINIDNQQFYDVLKQSIEHHRVLYQAYEILHDDQRAFECYRIILQGEKNLSIIRSCRLPSKRIHQTP